jgi:hypothetical protein
MVTLHYSKWTVPYTIASFVISSRRNHKWTSPYPACFSGKVRYIFEDGHYQDFGSETVNLNPLINDLQQSEDEEVLDLVDTL